MFRDTIETVYLLREGDSPLVQCGDSVAAGDVLAIGPGLPAIVPYAALLRLSAAEAAGDVARQDGEPCIAGRSLGARRTGLITRTVSAPATGSIRSLVSSGALLISDETAAYQHRAQYAGAVRDVSQRAIILTSAVARCIYAFADTTDSVGPLHIEPALLDAASTGEVKIPEPQIASSTVVAHIGDAAHLTAVRRSFHGTLIVGSVTEPVAWALLDHAEPATFHRAKGPGIVVLSGIGDAEHGARAVGPFRHLDNAAVSLDRCTHTMTIIPFGDLLHSDPFSGSAVTSGMEWRDPANYGMSCDARGAPTLAVTNTGARALCVMAIGDSVGAHLTPAQNLHSFKASED